MLRECSALSTWVSASFGDTRGSTSREIIYGAYGETLSWRDATDYNAHSIYLGGKPIASYQADGTTLFLRQSRLGSTQVVMRADNTYVQAQNFFSFGGSRWSAGGTQDLRFASMQPRDLVRGNRELASAHRGRTIATSIPSFRSQS